MTTRTQARGLFEVDVAGLQQSIADDAVRILFEPIANALDTDARFVWVTFTMRRGIAALTVEDDDPHGFHALEEAYTLWAPSRRKATAQARGRFGEGEKMLVALAHPRAVVISSTTGTVTFANGKRIVARGRDNRRARGSCVTAEVALSPEQAEAFRARVRTLLVPEGVHVQLRLDGEAPVDLVPRAAITTCTATLPTVLADASGVLRATRRQTEVRVHAVREGEAAMLYELGVPVCDIPGPWHLDIGQKVPLGRDRSSVTPAYLRAVQVAVLSAAHGHLPDAHLRDAWVTGALAVVSPDALRALVHRTHGERAVIFDPSCREASKRAVDDGRTVVHGGTYDRDIWEAIKTHGVLRPAGDYKELRGDVPTSPDGVPNIPRDEWRPEWRRLEAYTRAVAAVVGFPAVDVAFIRLPGQRAGAWCSPRLHRVTYNVAMLPGRFFGDQEAVDDLIIHELAHIKGGEHLTDRFEAELSRIGARLRACPTRLADLPLA